MSSSEEDRPAVVAVHARYKTRISRSQHANGVTATAPGAVLQRGVLVERRLHRGTCGGSPPTLSRPMTKRTISPTTSNPSQTTGLPPPGSPRVHHVRVTEVDHDVDPFDSPLFTSGHPRRSTTGSGRGRVQPSGGDYDQLVDEVGELARSVSHLTRYVERLGATPPRRSVSRGGVPRRVGSAGGVRDTHSVGGGAHTQHRSPWRYADESNWRRRSDTPRARVGTRPDPLSRAVAIPARQRHRLGGQRPPARPRAGLRPLRSRESRRRLHPGTTGRSRPTGPTWFTPSSTSWS